MSTPVAGGRIIFAFSGVHRPPSGRLVSAQLKEKYLSYLYQIWYGSLILFIGLIACMGLLLVKIGL